MDGVLQSASGRFFVWRQGLSDPRMGTSEYHAPQKQVLYPNQAWTTAVLSLSYTRHPYIGILLFSMIPGAYAPSSVEFSASKMRLIRYSVRSHLLH